jgi:hypothetical protein
MLLLLAVLAAAPAAAATRHATHVRAAAPVTGAPRASIPLRAAPQAPRTLEDIHIEGEIPVPQVLFITAREQRRFLEFQHHRYLRTSRQLGEATLPPEHVLVTSSPLTPSQERPR